MVYEHAKEDHGNYKRLNKIRKLEMRLIQDAYKQSNSFQKVIKKLKKQRKQIKKCKVFTIINN